VVDHVRWLWGFGWSKQTIALVKGLTRTSLTLENTNTRWQFLPQPMSSSSSSLSTMMVQQDSTIFSNDTTATNDTTVNVSLTTLFSKSSKTTPIRGTTTGSRRRSNILSQFLNHHDTTALSNTFRQLNVLYLDADLCIMTEGGLDQPFQVYTKNLAWTNGTRRVWYILQSIRYWIRESLMFHLWNIWWDQRYLASMNASNNHNKHDTTASVNASTTTNTYTEPILCEIDNANSKVRVLKIGNINNIGKLI
jgi:hypothetical protein